MLVAEVRVMAGDVEDMWKVDDGCKRSTQNMTVGHDEYAEMPGVEI